VPVDRTFSGVRILNSDGTAPLLNITVSGPPSILDKLKAEDLQIGLQAVGISSIMERRLVVAPELEGKVTLKSINNW